MSSSVRQLNSQLYYAAVAADDAYVDVLKRIYGPQAQDKRYTAHTDLQVLLARRVKLEADERWLTEMRAHSAATSTAMRFAPGEPARLVDPSAR